MKREPIIINEITQEILDKLAEIDRDSVAMHVIPPPKMFIHMQVHDVDGDLEMDYKFKCNSWHRNAYNGHAGCWLQIPCNSGGTTWGAGTLAIKTTGGTVYSTGAEAKISDTGATLEGVLADSSHGIVIGRGTGAENFEDYMLGDKIFSGNSSGLMAYQADQPNAYTYDAGLKKWTATKSRIFNNNSGASITVNEVGMYGRIQTGYSNYYMICRDKLSVGVPVANGSQLTVNMTFELTFPW